MTDPESAGTNELPTGFGAGWVNLIVEKVLGLSGALGDLDRRSGDGDFGANVAAALRRAEKNIADTAPTDYAGYLTAASRGFLGTGGTSGPLFGMFFRDLAKCASGAEPTVAEFAQGLAAGLATVQRYGKAEVGHKTMVDALAPAAAAMAKHVDDRAPAAEVFDAAAAAAVTGAISTAAILASRGRASYVGEVARGVLDPGAVAAAVMVQCAAAAQAGSDAVDTTWFDEASR